MKICNKCGSSNKDTNNFCSSCGQKLENTVIQNPVQPNNPSSECQITFQRPQSLQMMANAFHIKVDNSMSYELKNGGEIKIPMSSGQHSIEISVFSLPKKKQFNLQVSGNMTFICKPNPAAAVTFFSAPVKVTGSNGREY